MLEFIKQRLVRGSFNDRFLEIDTIGFPKELNPRVRTMEDISACNCNIV